MVRDIAYVVLENVTNRFGSTLRLIASYLYCRGRNIAKPRQRYKKISHQARGKWKKNIRLNLINLINLHGIGKTYTFAAEIQNKRV